MTCPECKTKIEDSDYCPRCGLQVSVFNKMKINKLNSILYENDPWRDFDTCEKILSILKENNLISIQDISNLQTELDSYENEARIKREAETAKYDAQNNKQLKKELGNFVTIGCTVLSVCLLIALVILCLIFKDCDEQINKIGKKENQPTGYSNQQRDTTSNQPLNYLIRQ